MNLPVTIYESFVTTFVYIQQYLSNLDHVDLQVFASHGFDQIFYKWTIEVIGDPSYIR